MTSLAAGRDSLAARPSVGYVPTRPLRYFAWEELEGRMRVRDRVRDCVVFLGRMNSGQFEPYGTAFIVLLWEGNNGFQYLVTAKHVLDKINSDTVHFRVNLKAGGSEINPTKRSDWVLHPDPGKRRVVDLAVVQVGIDLSYYDVGHWVLDEAVATEEMIRKYDIGIGDEVVTVGLFTRHFGDARNTPLVRVGNIARMVEEPLFTYDGYMDAYLIEARSIGGLSGSPVFVNMPPFRITETDEQKGLIRQMRTDEEIYLLLGVVQGHFVIENPEDAIIEDDKSAGKINTGIAVVVPVQKIMETLDHPDLRAHRASLIEAERREIGLVSDAASPPPDAGDGSGLPAGEFADDDWLDPAEAARRRDETLRRMLNTPPRPRKGGKPR